MPTVRQQIVQRLQQGEATVRQLAAELERPIARITDDLQHIQRSLGRRLQVEPSRCLACGFVLSKRQRFTAPSRCPRCRSEQTTEPRLSLR
jgi:predicted Zn-ribbon and HTH transcriptional regulator